MKYQILFSREKKINKKSSLYRLLDLPKAWKMLRDLLVRIIGFSECMPYCISEDKKMFYS